MSWSYSCFTCIFCSAGRPEQVAPLPRFFLQTLVLLVPCYLFWYLLHPWISNPVAWALHLHLTSWMPDVVEQVRGDGIDILVQTAFSELDGRLVRDPDADTRLAFPFDSRIVTFSLPFYAALTLATPGPDRLDTFFRGFLVLMLGIYVAALGVALQSMVTALGVHFTQVGGDNIHLRSALAMYYQFSTLILPVVGPVVVWGWQSRRSILLIDLLPAPAGRHGHGAK